MDVMAMWPKWTTSWWSHVLHRLLLGRHKNVLVPKIFSVSEVSVDSIRVTGSGMKWSEQEALKSHEDIQKAAGYF